MSAEEKPTVEFSAPPDWAIALTEKVTQGFAKTNANIELVSNDLDVLKGRVGNLESARVGDEERARLNSMRAKEPSQHDLETASALAQEIVAREALSRKVDAVVAENVAQTAMLTTLTGAAKKLGSNPTVHTIAILLGAAIIAWLKGHIQ